MLTLTIWSLQYTKSEQSNNEEWLIISFFHYYKHRVQVGIFKENIKNCRFVLDVMKTKQDLRFQALRLIHYIIYRVIYDDKDLQTFHGSITELAEAFQIPRSNLYRDIDSLSDQLHSTSMITGHKDPRKSWKIVTWMSKSGYDGKGIYTFKLSYSIVDYVKGIKQMFDEDFHLTILKFSSIYAIRIYEIVSADRFFQRNINPEYEIDDLRYWLDCEKKYKKTNDFYKYVIEIAVRDLLSFCRFYRDSENSGRRKL